MRLAQAPGEGDLWAWTNEFKITLRAYEVPYWEDEAESTAEIGSGGVAAGTFLVEGSGPAEPGVEEFYEFIRGYFHEQESEQEKFFRGVYEE